MASSAASEAVFERNLSSVSRRICFRARNTAAWNRNVNRWLLCLASECARASSIQAAAHLDLNFGEELLVRPLRSREHTHIYTHTQPHTNTHTYTHIPTNTQTHRHRHFWSVVHACFTGYTRRLSQRFTTLKK